MFETLFQRRKMNRDKLLAYGFKERENSLQYITTIVSDTFSLHIDIDPNGTVDTALFEITSSEEYILYKTNAAGRYVGKIRTAVETVLSDIAKQCYEPVVFQATQSQNVIAYVKDKYGDELEFLWEKLPDNAIWRRKDNGKWYAAILTVSKEKLGIDSKEKAEILDLRTQPKKMPQLLAKPHYYPGWHMNKKHWYTIILDGSLSDAEIYQCIEESYDLTGKIKR